MKILLRNMQVMLGDKLMFTPVVRDLKATYPDWQIAVESASPEIWNNNPHITKFNNPDGVFQIGPAEVTKGSKTNGLHFTEAFRVCLEKKLSKPIKQGPFKPDIYLSEAEKDNHIIDGHYWVINIDCGPFSAKRWPAERFQRVVDKLHWLTFVQVGLSKDNTYRLKGANVIDLVDQTKIRELFSLVYNAQGCISLISSLMHVAAAFDKPCVVLAGAREPTTFEAYPNHRYLHRVGCLPCAAKQACWHNSIGACKNKVISNFKPEIAKCMDMIRPKHVIDAIEDYYEGGLLQKPQIETVARKKKVIRIISNAKCLGGAERSVIEIAKIFCEQNWRVEISPHGFLCKEFADSLPGQVTITNHITRPVDILLLYSSDMVFSFDKAEFEIFNRIAADRKVMALTYKLGKAGQVDWTRKYDKYLFLSTALSEAFGKRLPASTRAILAPPVALQPFLAVQPVYDGSIHLLRHSSQGDSKFPADLPEIMGKTNARFSFMPGPSWLKSGDRIQKIEYSNNPQDVANFLGSGNCYWYLLPEGYTDQGPRVIVEAIAAGLPVIAENRDGARDRVTEKEGWLLNNHNEAIELINSLTPEILERKGQAARQRAIREFRKERWFEEIIG